MLFTHPVASRVGVGLEGSCPPRVSAHTLYGMAQAECLDSSHTMAAEVKQVEFEEEAKQAVPVASYPQTLSQLPSPVVVS